MDVRRRKAHRRLHKDLQELADRSWELPTVSALPLEDNILEWHCNIVGRAEHDGVVLHLKLIFPETYPHQPPEVVLMSKVCHPNVFGDHLCLDMLEEGQWADPKERDAEYTGWSNCYSVFSILMQLQAFLFDLGNNAARMRNAAEKCECYCGHGIHRIYPPFPEPVDPPKRPEIPVEIFGDEDDASSAGGLEVPDEVVGHVSRVERYGAFITLDDGRTGLLHKSEAPRGMRFELSDKIVCRVKVEKPLSFTLIRTEEEMECIVVSGSKVNALVTGWKPYGVFVDVGGRSTLLHRTETDLLRTETVPWEVGEEIPVRILSLTPKMSVSAKTLILRPVPPRPLLDLIDADLERLRCYHSKATLGEAVFGVGIAFESEDMPNGQKRYHLTSVYDVLAYESFQDGVRKGVWKQKFHEFLPLALDEGHFKQGRRVLENIVAKLTSGAMAEKLRSTGKTRDEKEEEFNARITFDQYKQKLQKDKESPPEASGPPPPPPVDDFTPNMILKLIPKLMNSQVVLISSGQLWRSQKALEGYFAYHHLLLHCLHSWPKLRTRIEKQCQDFFENPDMRSKEHVPNLGEFLCLVSVSDKYGWEELGIPILVEAFTRNALWVLRQTPKLGELTDAGVSLFRLNKTFQANIVSLRLLMFQMAFLQLAKPPHTHEPDGPVCRAASCQLGRKDRCKGLPGLGEAEWLFKRCVRILAVDDWSEFLELVGAAHMDELEVCRWLRRSILASIRCGYHNPRYFSSLCAPKEKKKEERSDDPEDFGMDTRPKESKAEKRKRRAAVLQERALASSKNREFNMALSWARFHAPHGYTKRQALVIIDSSEKAQLESSMDKDGTLQGWWQSAQRGWRLLDNVKMSKINSFPARLWFGVGCIDCEKYVKCEMSGRCYTCCVKLAKAPGEAKPVKGLSKPGGGGLEARFGPFQAQAEMPVTFEMQYEVGFAGLVADIAPLRAALSDDLTVTSAISGIMTFTRVVRSGRGLWEKAPEQTMVPGCKLLSGWQGVTDCLFSLKIRGMSFALLQDTMHNVKTLDDLELLRMNRTYCKDHLLRDPKTKMCNICNLKNCKDEAVCRAENWNRVCPNCRGVLRLRFQAPQRFAARKEQLDKLSITEFSQRAMLCGLQDQLEGFDAEKRKDCTNFIIKSEGVIR